MPDNGITWLEPTAQCNLNCYGCYRKNIKNSHEPLDEAIVVNPAYQETKEDLMKKKELISKS